MPNRVGGAPWRWIRLVAAVVTALACSGCGRASGRAHAAPPALQTTEEGVASWYGHPYHGRPTASGETYDMDRLTAAHRTLPLGARVRVENLASGRQVEVRINDRGPFAKERIIDLSRVAAQQIGMIGPGTARVRLHLLGLPEAPAQGFFAVQAGAFLERANALRLRDSLKRQHGAAVIENYDSPQGRFYRVLVGRHKAPADAAALATTLDGFVVRVDRDRL